MRPGAPVESAARRRAAVNALRRTAVGRFDPTTRCTADEYWRAALTPHGPATVRATIAADGEPRLAGAWGPGADWLAARLSAMAGGDDIVPDIEAHHASVARAQRRHAVLRLGRTDDLYGALLATVIAQRITAFEAIRQWSRVVRHLGAPAPGPHPDLMTPPEPARLASQPAWAMHPWGIEGRRAATLRAVARRADHFWGWARSPRCAELLGTIDGVGPWTVATVLGEALGDPDAVPVGDYHVKNMVCYALGGAPRGTDEEMLIHLQPYAGQRGRVIRYLIADGWQAPKFGPRQRILPMAQW